MATDRDDNANDSHPKELRKALVKLMVHRCNSQNNYAIVQAFQNVFSSYTKEDITRTVVLEDNSEDALNILIHCALEQKAPLKIVQLLLEYDDTPKQLLMGLAGDYQTPLHIACKKGAPLEVVQLW